MCQIASFLYRGHAIGVDLRVWDMESHSETQEHYPECTEARGWYEGHYLPSGELVCRSPYGRDAASEAVLRERYPRFGDFLAAFPDAAGKLRELSAAGCDLSGAVLPAGLRELYADGANLSGVALPEGLERLDADGCDLSGVALPAGLRELSASGCDLSGVTLPAGLEGLSANGCDLSSVALPSGLRWLYAAGCDLSGVAVPVGCGVYH